MTAACRACLGHWPDAGFRVADCGLSVAYLHDDQFFAGWTVLVLKAHATELFELAAAERARLIEEVSAVARAVAEAFDARKMNYALLGNQLPHVHWHLIPRLAADPDPLASPFGVAHAPVAVADTERDARIARIRARLAPGVAARP